MEIHDEEGEEERGGGEKKKADTTKMGSFGKKKLFLGVEPVHLSEQLLLKLMTIVVGL